MDVDHPPKAKSSGHWCWTKSRGWRDRRWQETSEDVERYLGTRAHCRRRQEEVLVKGADHQLLTTVIPGCYLVFRNIGVELRICQWTECGLMDNHYLEGRFPRVAMNLRT
jgi:hypothetical protein